MSECTRCCCKQKAQDERWELYKEKLQARAQVVAQELYAAMNQLCNYGHYITVEGNSVWVPSDEAWERGGKALDSADDLWPEYIFDASNDWPQLSSE